VKEVHQSVNLSGDSSREVLFEQAINSLFKTMAGVFIGSQSKLCVMAFSQKTNHREAASGIKGHSLRVT